jgi:hypothetical protein
VSSLAATALIFLDVIRGTHTLLADGDSADQSFTWLSKVFAATRAGTVALWDFTTASGTSFIGELQTAPTYPVSILFGLFAEPGDPYGIDLFLLLHFFVAALGFQVFCRTLGLSPAGGLLGAAILAFGSTAAIRVSGQPNLFASLAWTPWIHWAMVCAVRTPRIADRMVYLAAGTAATASAFLAGHVHALVFAIGGAGVTAMAGGVLASEQGGGTVRKGLRTLGAIACIGVLAGGLVAPQLAAVVEYLRLSYKWYGPGFTTFPHVVPYEQFAAASLHLPDLATLFTGGEVQALDGGTLYVTKVGAALALVALCSAILEPTGRRLVAAGTLMAGTGLAFAFSPVVGLGWVFYSVPGFNLVRVPGRGLFLYAAGMALLGAIGLDRLQRAIHRAVPGTPSAATVLAGAALAVCGLEIHEWLPDQVQRTAGDPRSQVENIRNGRVAMFLRELSSEGPIHRYFAPNELVPPNLGNVHPVLSAHGYRSTRTRAYHDDFSFNPFDPRIDQYAVRWWVAPRPIPGLPVLRDFGTAVVHERPAALPVFWLARGDGLLGLSLTTVEWNHNSVTVQLPTPVTGRVVFAQSVFPGWVVHTAAGRRAVVAHQGLMAADVVEARSITFEYAPSWWMPTVAISTSSLVLVVAATAVVCWRRFSCSSHE